jgi:hypothetical protein
MPGLVPGIHALGAIRLEDVDGRDKPGHDASVGLGASHQRISFTHSSSVSTATPSFFASASFEPALGPAIR